jgi:hypothetical protein
MPQHSNERIHALWQKSVATILNLAPQMPPDQVHALHAALTPTAEEAVMHMQAQAEADTEAAATGKSKKK